VSKRAALSTEETIAYAHAYAKLDLASRIQLMQEAARHV
jgi:hypothetical protein